MPRFDRTEANFIQQKIDETIKETRTGKVIQVYEHLEPGDTSNFEADVTVDGGTRLERLAAVIQPGHDTISVPAVGDTVLLGFLAGDGEKPLILGHANTVRDRPQFGKAGMRRDLVESGESPAGSGDLQVTKYTKYGKEPATVDKSQLEAEEAYVQITKGDEPNPEPDEDRSLPAKIEFYDSPANDEAHIEIKLNREDGGETDASWGLSFDFKTGEVKLVDPSGYGFVSDGEGNWTWEYDSKTENQVSGGGSLSI